jgi:S1-C subfamily serine protease
MNRFTSLVALLVIFTTPSHAQSPWTSIADRVEKAIVFIEVFDEDDTRIGACTGAVIHVLKQYVLSASHCDGKRILINGTQAFRIFKDDRHDLMVLRAAHLDADVAIPIARNSPKRGEEVANMGYGRAFVDPMFRIAHISNVNLQIEGLAASYTVIDNDYVEGQSGGVLVNLAGELVSIVQRGAPGFGFGVGVDTIRDRAGKYFE